MVGIVTRQFRGKVPRKSSRLLDDAEATVCTNAKITSGKLSPVNGPSLTHSSLISGTIQTMFRYRFNAIDNWLVWNADVDVARSPTTQDARGRLYYTGDGEPRMTTYADAISGGGPYPAAWYVLGVCPPKTAPALTVVGGSSTTEIRSYLYTFVTQYGEESGPSPAFVSTSQFINGSWNLSALDAAPPNSGTISAALNNSPSAGYVRLTVNSTFGLFANEKISISGVVGMTDLNTTFTIVSVDTASNYVVVQLTTVQTYTSGGTWTRLAPHNTTNMTKRIYRVSGGRSDYRLVAEIAVATTTYNDTIAETTVAASSVIPSLTTQPPPKNGTNMVALANGALAMLSGNTVCLSEAYKPYSWPAANQYNIPATGVAMTSSGNSLIVLTDGFPYIITATAPEAASVGLLPGDVFAPCVSKQGCVDTGDGCLYPSHDGLYLASSGGAKNVTTGLYRKDEWKALNASTFKAEYSGMAYYAARTDSLGARSIWFLDVAEPNSSIDFDESADALYQNTYDGSLYISKLNKVYKWDGDTTNRKMLTWTSKVFVTPYPVNFGVAQVEADYSEIVPASTVNLDTNLLILANADNVDGELAAIEIGMTEITGSLLKPVSSVGAGFVQVSVLYKPLTSSSMQVVYSTRPVNNRPFRLPAGYLSDTYQLQIDSNIPVSGFTVAQVMSELGQV